MFIYGCINNVVYLTILINEECLISMIENKYLSWDSVDTESTALSDSQFFAYETKSDDSN